MSRSHFTTHPPKNEIIFCYYQVNLRRRFVGPPIKLVLKLSLCFGQSGFDDVLLRDIQLWVLLDKLTHRLLNKELKDQTLQRSMLLSSK